MERDIYCPDIGERTHKDQAQDKKLDRSTLSEQAMKEVHADIMTKTQKNHLAW